MNHNAAVVARAARFATQPALTHPLAGRIYEVAIRGDARVHIHCDGRRTLGALIAWAYQLDTPVLSLKAFLREAHPSVHVHVEGHLDGIPVTVFTGFYGVVARELVERVDMVDNEAIVSIHHLRAVQAGTYRTAVAA